MSFVVTDYSFGEFVLDNEQRILLREGKPVALAPKVFDTLLMLVENSGRIVTKQELMNRVWPDTFVEEDNLTYNIKQLRKTFGDDARNPLYIETIARRGYRFIAAVKPGETKQPADNKLELIANPQQQSYGELFTQTGFLHRVDDAENQTSTGAVALADWRRKTSTNGSKESVVAVTPETPTGKVANLEIVRPAPGKRATYLYGLAGVIGLVLLAGIGYGIYRFGRATTNPAVSSLKTTRLTSNGKTKTAAVSPEGKFVAYVLEDKDEQSLWLKNIPTGSDVQILVPAKKTAIGPITISRDGNFVFYGSSDGTTQAIFQLPVLGGMPKKVLANYSGPISFSPDGKQFAFIRYSSGGEETAAIVIVNSDGSDERVIASSKRPAIFLRSAAWSPDGKIIACAALNPSGQQEVVAVRVADGIVSPVPSPRWRVIWEIVWRPDGESLLVTAADSSSSNQIWSVPFPSGQARRITNDSSDYRSISLPSDSSAIVAVREQQEAHLWIMPSEIQPE